MGVVDTTFEVLYNIVNVGSGNNSHSPILYPEIREKKEGEDI